MKKLCKIHIFARLYGIIKQVTFPSRPRLRFTFDAAVYKRAGNAHKVLTFIKG